MQKVALMLIPLLLLMRGLAQGLESAKESNLSSKKSFSMCKHIDEFPYKATVSPPDDESHVSSSLL